ncbi:MAG: SPFH domain-containing protein [Candidatus Nanopelagicales bacterium]
MGLWDKLMGEFIDVIQWTDDSNDTLVYRFERQGNEIKFGAKLTVREGQVAVFVNEGQLADTFQPGMYELKTNNLPILSTLQAWKHGFESPFKAEVYFFSTRRFTDLKWGTQNPVMLRDPEFGPIRLRAFGSYAIRVKDAPTFLREIVGTDGRFTTDEITNQLRNMVVSRFTNILGQSKIPALDLAGNYDQLGQFLLQRIAPEFEAVGLELTNLLVENISLAQGGGSGAGPAQQHGHRRQSRSVHAVPGGGSHARCRRQSERRFRSHEHGAGAGDGPALERNLGATGATGGASPDAATRPGADGTSPATRRQSLLRGRQQPAGRTVPN